jgi:hypothetical protein
MKIRIPKIFILRLSPAKNAGFGKLLPLTQNVRGQFSNYGGVVFFPNSALFSLNFSLLSANSANFGANSAKLSAKSFFTFRLRNTTALCVIQALPMPCNSQEGNCIKTLFCIRKILNENNCRCIIQIFGEGCNWTDYDNSL